MNRDVIIGRLKTLANVKGCEVNARDVEYLRAAAEVLAAMPDAEATAPAPAEDHGAALLKWFERVRPEPNTDEATAWVYARRHAEVLIDGLAVADEALEDWRRDFGPIFKRLAEAWNPWHDASVADWWTYIPPSDIGEQVALKIERYDADLATERTARKKAEVRIAALETALHEEAETAAAALAQAAALQERLYELAKAHDRLIAARGGTAPLTETRRLILGTAVELGVGWLLRVLPNRKEG